MADTTTTTLNPTDLAWLALADKTLHTPDEVSMLSTWRPPPHYADFESTRLRPPRRIRN